MSVVLFTDAHFGVKSFSKKFFEYQMAFYRKQFFPYLIENNIKDVIFLGDFIHNQELMDNYIAQMVREEFLHFFGKNKINLWMILGNHDVYYKNTTKYNYLETIKDFPYINYIAEASVIEIEGIKFGFTS